MAQQREKGENGDKTIFYYKNVMTTQSELMKERYLDPFVALKLMVFISDGTSEIGGE